jgi:hypothetical protein
VVIFGANLAARAMMVSLFRLVARWRSQMVELLTQEKTLSGDSLNNHSDFLFK